MTQSQDFYSQNSHDFILKLEIYDLILANTKLQYNFILQSFINLLFLHFIFQFFINFII